MSDPLPDSENPFEVMGVARDVSELDLKKRYFQLLRLYPPETHPEDFNRLQRAYEVLKDPDARARVSQGEPYEEVREPYRTRLREALAQLVQGQVEIARAALKTMVQEDGSLEEARDLLQKVLFNDEDFAGAQVQLEALVQLKPENTWYLYRQALVLARLERHAEAAASCEAWIRVSQGKDVLAWEFLAEALASQNRMADAYARLEAGLAQVEHQGPLIITRMHLRLRGELKDDVRMKFIEADLAALLGSLRPDDDERRKVTAERLQSLAAVHFNKNHSDCANRILKAARELAGKTEAAVQFPAKLEVFLEELQPPSQQWLVEEANKPHIFRVARRGRFSDVFVAMGLTLLWAGLALGVLNARITSVSSWLVLGAVLAVSTWPVLWAWRELAWSFGAQHRRMTSIHPLYLLEVGVEKLRAYPLVNLNNVGMVHHYTNGAYTHSALNLEFARKKLTLNISGQQLAVEFAETLQGHRYRALQLMHGGLLEAEAGFDFVPFTHLDPGFVSPVRKAKRKSALALWGAAAVTALVLSVVGGAQSFGRQRQEAWTNALALNGGQAPAVPPPDAAARRALEGLQARTLARAKESLATLPVGPEREAGEVLLAALAAARQGAVKLEVSLLPQARPAGLDDAALKAAFSDSGARLLQGFEAARSAAVRGAFAVSKSEGLPVVVKLTPRATDTDFVVGAKRFTLLALEVEATLEGKPLARTQVALARDDLARFATAASAEAVARTQLAALLERAGAALAQQLGLSARLTLP